MDKGSWLKEKGWATLALIAFVFCFCGRVSLAVELSAAEPLQSSPSADGESETAGESELDLEDIDVERYLWHSSQHSLSAPGFPGLFAALIVDCRIAEPPESPESFA